MLINSDFEFQRNDVQAIFSEDPTSLLPFLLKLDSYLNNIENDNFLLRKLNFLTYDLLSKCEGLKPEDSLNVLNELFFDAQAYNCSAHSEPNLEDYSFSQLFTNKEANSIVLVILFQYLASKLNLPIYAISVEPLHIVKWLGKESTKYIDIERHGKIFDQNEILQLLNGKHPTNDCFEIITIKHLFSEYLNSIVVALNKNPEHQKIITCLDLLLLIDDNDLKSLGQRGLVKCKSGQFESAFKDFKRYFVFTDYNCAPKEIRIAYQQLCELKVAKDCLSPENNTLH